MNSIKRALLSVRNAIAALLRTGNAAADVEETHACLASEQQCKRDILYSVTTRCEIFVVHDCNQGMLLPRR